MKTKTRRILKGSQTWKIKKLVLNCFLSTQGNVVEGESVFNIVWFFSEKNWNWKKGERRIKNKF